MITHEKCTVDEYLNGDDDLPVCLCLDNDSWEGNFLAQLRQKEQEVQYED